jgi:hypothetical protein
MNDSLFWGLVYDTREEAKGDDIEQTKILSEHLLGSDTQQVVQFVKQFFKFHSKAYRFDLLGAVYTINQGITEEEFGNFRAWLVLQGEQFYFNVIDNPDSLPVFEELEEALIMIEEVFRDKVGRYISDEDIKEIVVDDPGEKWDFEDTNEIKRRLPSIYRDCVLGK